MSEGVGQEEGSVKVYGSVDRDLECAAVTLARTKLSPLTLEKHFPVLARLTTVASRPFALPLASRVCRGPDSRAPSRSTRTSRHASTFMLYDDTMESDSEGMIM